MKFKTLKDVDCHDAISIFKFRENLKQEAIKFCKAIVKESAIGFYCTICEKFNCDCRSSDRYKLFFLEEVRKTLMFIANLTEEDLK